MKFIVISALPDGRVHVEEETAESIEILKEKILYDSEGYAKFVEDVSKFQYSESWPSSTRLIIQGKVI